MLQKMPDVYTAYIAYIGIIIPKLYFRSIGSLQNTVGSFSVGQVSDPMSQCWDMGSDTCPNTSAAALFARPL